MDGDAGARGEGLLSPLRNDAGCRNFGEDEEDLIIKLHALLGDRWSLIAGRLPGRTDNEVKNHWDSYLKGKLINMGIDPENHRLPRIRPVENSTDTDQVSDVAPHLNLGLSMTSISSASSSFNNEVLQQHVDSKAGQETRSGSSPTLLLFK